jgi:hypothetical protein
MRVFHLARRVDVSQVSGCSECIASGVEWVAGGECAIRWNTETPSIEIHKSLEIIRKIHGHEDKTVVIFDTPEEIPIQKG